MSSKVNRADTHQSATISSILNLGGSLAKKSKI